VIVSRNCSNASAVVLMIKSHSVVASTSPASDIPTQSSETM